MTSCSGTNILNYKYKKRYHENSTIRSDESFTLIQSVCFNEPRVRDEEFCYTLHLIFLDTIAAKTKKNLNLETDTLIVKSSYRIFSVWNWEDENNKVTGQIKIVAWNKNSITLKENICVSDFRRNETTNFKGTRTYRRKEEL